MEADEERAPTVDIGDLEVPHPHGEIAGQIDGADGRRDSPQRHDPTAEAANRGQIYHYRRKLDQALAHEDLHPQPVGHRGQNPTIVGSGGKEEKGRRTERSK